MRKKLIAIFAGLISSLILPFLVSSASAEEVRSMKLWAREQAAGPAPHTAALIIAQTLNELGLDITVNAVPWPQMADKVWYNRLDEDNWDLTMWQMVSRPERSDPDEFTYNLFHSSTAEKGYNFIGYVSSAYDELAEKQRVTMDPDARKKIVDQAQQLLADDAAKAQQGLGVQIEKVRQEYLALIREFTEGSAFKTVVSLALSFASALL